MPTKAVTKITQSFTIDGSLMGTPITPKLMQKAIKGFFNNRGYTILNDEITIDAQFTCIEVAPPKPLYQWRWNPESVVRRGAPNNYQVLRNDEVIASDLSYTEAQAMYEGLNTL